MRKIQKMLFITMTLLLTIVTVTAQVTTGSISGTIKDKKGNVLTGATILAKHEPTSTVYTVVSRAGGRFDFTSVIPGGPYTLTASYVGYQNFNLTDINVPLGDKYDVTIEIEERGVVLTEVVVSGSRSGSQKTGASSNFSRRQVANLPNISRSLTAITRATPQSNGNSFAGINSRFNNLTIDGSLFNNNFGRSGDGFVPGGASSAISIDAIDQIQVNIAPYDVRQSGFIGGGVNAVTRRGTNNWYGTAYSFYRDQSFNGKKVISTTVANQPRKTQIYGGSIGGPIIKDKLFFFVNVEYEQRTSPGQTWLARRPGVNDGNPQNTPVLATDLDQLSTYLKNTYQINTGGYEIYDFETTNLKFIGRLDWNVHKNHKLSVRFTKSETDDDDQVNTSSTSGISANTINNGRRGGVNGGLAYQSSNFKNNVRVLSGVAELNSSFGKNVTNQLLVSYTDNQLDRVPPIDAPFVDIMRGPNDVYISFGRELFSYLNLIDDNALNIANNITFTLGKHTVTGGVSYEKLQFGNSFTSAAGGAYYRYNSLADFLSNSSPAVFAVAYDPSNPKGIKVPEAKFNQLGVYVQDAWNLSEKLKITYGLRIDQPFYPYTPPQNPALAALTFSDQNRSPERFDVSKWPASKVLFSPRVGFSYDPYGNRKLIIRGGTGLFTGRIPFIWLVNQVGDNGIVRATYQASGAALAAIRYNTDRTTYIPTNPPAVGTSTASNQNYSGVDNDFKLPQVWRTNLAIDQKLTENLILNIEGIFTQMVNNAYFRNANLGTQNGTLGGAVNNRPFYNRRLEPNADRMAVLDNTSKGSSAVFTVGLQKNFAKGWEVAVSYTNTIALDVSAGTSDQSASAWQTNGTYSDPNNPELGYSGFSVPHRFIASFSKRFEYLNKNMATTISFFYSGQSQDRYHFRYGGDINGDGSTNDNIYIPKDPSEIQFVEGFRVGTIIHSAAAQSAAFFQFIENNPYLSKHKGQYMDRYAAVLPFLHTMDLRILQDFSIKAGNKKHTFQISADVINFLNLLNSDWGYRYSYTFGNFSDLGLLGLPSSTNNTGAETFNRAVPKYTFNPYGPAKAYQPNFSTSSTWGIQLGLRYIFN